MVISSGGKTIEVNGTMISISEKFTKKQKTIPVSSVISVQIKKPGLLGGYLYFQTIGGLDNSSMKSVTDYIKDENAIVLPTKKSYQLALEIKEYVERMQSSANGINQSSTNGANQSSSADELIKYKQLLDGGVITQQEFELKKKELLGL